VRGFALTLALGVVVSMFTAITRSRTFMFLAMDCQRCKPELLSKPARIKEGRGGSMKPVLTKHEKSGGRSL